MPDHGHILSKEIVYLFNECIEMTKEQYFDDTLPSVKYNNNKTLEMLPLCMNTKYAPLDKSLVTLPRTIFATRLLSLAVYFMQTGGSALSCTYH